MAHSAYLSRSTHPGVVLYTILIFDIDGSLWSTEHRNYAESAMACVLQALRRQWGTVRLEYLNGQRIAQWEWTGTRWHLKLPQG